MDEVPDYSYPYRKIIILFQGYEEEQKYIRLLRAVWRDGKPLDHPMGYERW